MFENYLANQSDLSAVGEGLKCVWNPKLDFIFKKRKLIEEVVIVSYDSQNFYLWKHRGNKSVRAKGTKIETFLNFYEVYKISHNLKIGEKYQSGWSFGFVLEPDVPLEKIVEFSDLKPRSLISGSLLGPFLSSQKIKTKRMNTINPYTTRESYLATIVHEFGHFYFDRHLTWWYSNKKENLNCLKVALNQYSGKAVKDPKAITFPNYGDRSILLSEIFAFCTDYSVATIFWHNHKNDIDAANKNEIVKLITDEKRKNLIHENSVLDPSPAAHTAAMVFGKLLISNYPDAWPEKLIHSNQLVV